ncbi:MAG: hypothetical protein ACREBE_17365, partial [bacterium]
IDPSASLAVARVSFTAGGTQTGFRARLVNGSVSALPVLVRWSETTLYSAAWSTNGSTNTFYTLQNTTGATVHGVLTLYGADGVAVSTAPLNIPPGQTGIANTAGLGTPRSRTGTARFSHDGPPGAMLAGATIANFSTSPAYAQPVKFVPMRQLR